jgi:acyl-CoA synthetase (AMP-forming)/AMP-acid ligase II
MLHIMNQLSTFRWDGVDTLDRWAERSPDRTAIVMGLEGTVTSYRDLNERSLSLANMLRAWGLRRGDGIAILMENKAAYLEIAWAAQRSGLYYTAVNWHFHPREVGYIIEDCEARVLFTSAQMADTVAQLAPAMARIERVVSVDGGISGALSYADCLANSKATPLVDPAEGCELLYSSGTTGRPKAVKRPLAPIGQMLVNHQYAAAMYRDRYGVTDDSVYLSPAPLYHSAPITSCLTIHRLGASVVVMERFDAEQSLDLIEHRQITHAQFVPTMFVRMLKLGDDLRRGYDVSSLRCAIHASAPCPVSVKRAMIAWWGPILEEYYSGTEGMGATTISSPEWLDHPGSVGRPSGCKIHIVGDDGVELAPFATGRIFFESDRQFEYFHDAEKTASVTDAHGWRTLGDVGHVDGEGYVYLTGRATFMIVSGGVNIYPQEIEDVLIVHPAVDDAAVFGVPNDEFGEEVKAIVQPASNVEADDDLAAELIEYCRDNLAHFKAPRSIEFADKLPRDPNGKLYKGELRERYWTGRSTEIM